MLRAPRPSHAHPSPPRPSRITVHPTTALASPLPNASYSHTASAPHPSSHHPTHPPTHPPTPAGKYLDQCPVSTPHDAAVGLILCGLAQHMAAPAQRHVPEALTFLRDCLQVWPGCGGVGRGVRSWACAAGGVEGLPLRARLPAGGAGKGLGFGRFVAWAWACHSTGLPSNRRWVMGLRVRGVWL